MLDASGGLTCHALLVEDELLAQVLVVVCLVLQAEMQVITLCLRVREGAACLSQTATRLLYLLLGRCCAIA